MSSNEPGSVNEYMEEDDMPLQYEQESVGEEGVETEKSDSYTGMSASEMKKHQVEYVQLLKDIEGQNKIVEQLKDQVFESCEKPCLTKCQLREIKRLRQCMENENLKLQCMVQKAVKLQNELPSKTWDEVPIVTTIDDDIFPNIGNEEVLQSLGLRPRSPAHSEICCRTSKKKKSHTRDCYECTASPPKACKLLKEMSIKEKLIKKLSGKLKALQQELCSQKKHAKKERDECRPSRSSVTTICRRKSSSPKMMTDEYQQKKSNDLRKLKDNYGHLLLCLKKKENQIKELQGRIKGYCANGVGNNSCGQSQEDTSVDKVELKLLREKVEDMKDEQEEFKCLIKEQSEQLDDYRRKYMDCQQIVEEQKSTLAKIDLNNKRIESQVEAEVKRIKLKFKEQLNELSQYPSLLENEQIKYASACKERDELEGQLKVVCRELKSMKDAQALKGPEKPDCSKKLATCEKELILLQKKLENLLMEKDIISKELVATKQDLDTLRTESARIITTTKERFESTKNLLNTRIDQLEKELAQCRANACMNISDREAVIKEMQSQLSTLSYSFDSAQKQIKTLKNHIGFLSNDKCIPIKC